MRPIGILGGTFDPIHHGHLRSALELLEGLELAQVRFIPCHQPPHRASPVASPSQRLAMLRQAVVGQPGFVIDLRELERDGPSYTVDTLTGLRTELGTTPLCLILGMDAFAGLHRWHRWQEILSLAHLLIMHRPGAEQPQTIVLAELVRRHKLHDPQDLSNNPAGGILFQAVSQLPISATAIRALLAQGLSPRYLMPETVRAYIDEQQLYRSFYSTQEVNN